MMIFRPSINRSSLVHSTELIGRMRSDFAVLGKLTAKVL